MKFSALLVVSLVSVSAVAAPVAGRVVAVDPVYTNVVSYNRVQAIETICEDVRYARRSDGLIERGTNGIFGSTQGLIGTAAGVAIGSQIGGGSGTSWAMAIGGLLGNSMGNNVARSRQNRTLVCDDVVQWIDEPVIEREFQHYNVTVDVQGQRFTVIRYTAPEIGEMTPITINVR